jgi:hypothetical protein
MQGGGCETSRGEMTMEKVTRKKSTSVDTLPTELLDHMCLSAPQLRRLLGAKSNGGMLSAHGLDALVREGVIPRPFMLGKFRRWRWGAVKAAIAKLERQAEGPS